MRWESKVARVRSWSVPQALVRWLRLMGGYRSVCPRMPQFMAMVLLKKDDHRLEFEVQLVQFQSIRKLVDKGKGGYRKKRKE
jgi:hypothetical protein